MEVDNILKIEKGEVPAQVALRWFENTDLVKVPSYFLTHWKTKKNFFFVNGALLAFENTKRHLIISGEPALTKGSDEELLYQSFLSFAHKKGRKVCGYCVGKSWHCDFFTKKPLGTSFRVHLDDYDFKSSKAKEVRRSLRKGLSSEYRVIESKDIDLVKFQSLLKKWRTKKLPLELKFLLSQPKQNSPTASFEKWYVVEKNKQYYAFCSALPYNNKAKKGFYIDHLIYDPKNEKSALSFLISSLIQNFKEKGVSELNLGLNPFAKIEPNGILEKAFRVLYHMPFYYRPKGIHYFKSKFAGEEEPEFFFYEKNESLWLSLIGMMKTTL